MLALVFPAEVAALPDIGPAIAAAGLGGAALEGIEGAFGVGLGGGVDAEDVAEIEEVLLGGGAFLEGDADPFLLEFDGEHAACGPRQGRGCGRGWS
ncbi:MAG: hypothetical protein QM753_18455 [Thermomicrobiales bacterium]